MTLTVVVCGEETIQASKMPRALNFVYPEGGEAPASSIPTSQLASFFTVGGDSAAYCGPSEFQIVKATDLEAGEFAPAPDADVKIADDLMTVNLSGAKFNNELYVQATTPGGKIAQQRLQVVIKGANNVC